MRRGGLGRQVLYLSCCKGCQKQWLHSSPDWVRCAAKHTPLPLSRGRVRPSMMSSLFVRLHSIACGRALLLLYKPKKGSKGRPSRYRLGRF